MDRNANVYSNDQDDSKIPLITRLPSIANETIFQKELKHLLNNKSLANKYREFILSKELEQLKESENFLSNSSQNIFEVEKISLEEKEIILNKFRKAVRLVAIIFKMQQIHKISIKRLQSIKINRDLEVIQNENNYKKCQLSLNQFF
jgi:hypothetical protein